MKILKQWVACAVTGFLFSALLAIRGEPLVIIAAGFLGAGTVSLIFLLTLAAVKFTKLTKDRSHDATLEEPLPRRLTGFDAEGNLRIHSWLWHGGR